MQQKLVFNSRLSKLGKLVSLSLLLVFTTQLQAISPEALKQGIPSLAPMLEEVTPAVVSIRVTKSVVENSRFFFNGEEMPESAQRFLQELPGLGTQQLRRPYATGAGSGVIVDAQEGLIITNHHVVAGASDIQVTLSDGRSVSAELLGSDARTDVALLKISMDELVEVAFADIATVQVGDYVVAIGNPFGIGQTVTSGIVSALGRAGINNDNYEDFIQTDAAINVGNSGGALIDMEGRLIGMNTAIISDNGGSNGIGFAVPGDMIHSVVEHLQRDGEVRRGLLGVSITDVSNDIAAALKVDSPAGAIVTRVLEDSAAERAGIEVSDIIVEIDGQSIAGSRELRNTVGLKLQDQEINLVLFRNGERKALQARIGGSAGQATVPENRAATNTEFKGAQLESLIDRGTNAGQGVQVKSVQEGDRAWNAGLRSGDVIIEVNRNTVTDIEAFTAAIDNDARFTALTVLREGRRMLLFLS